MTILQNGQIVLRNVDEFDCTLPAGDYTLIDDDGEIVEECTLCNVVGMKEFYYPANNTLTERV